MTNQAKLAIAACFSASILFVACSDNNQTPTRNIISDGSGGAGQGGVGQGGGGNSGEVNVAGQGNSGGSETAQGGIAGAASTSDSAGAPSGTAGTAGSANSSGAAGQTGVAPCVLSGKGCYDCSQPTLPQQFLNRCPIAGVTCEKFDNTRVPK